MDELSVRGEARFLLLVCILQEARAALDGTFVTIEIPYVDKLVLEELSVGGEAPWVMHTSLLPSRCAQDIQVCPYPQSRQCRFVSGSSFRGPMVHAYDRLSFPCAQNILAFLNV